MEKTNLSTRTQFNFADKKDLDFIKAVGNSTFKQLFLPHAISPAGNQQKIKVKEQGDISPKSQYFSNSVLQKMSLREDSFSFEKSYDLSGPMKRNLASDLGTKTCNYGKDSKMDK